ncbi:MAG: biotin--[acetyl-CoA-carboxylase] ligase [Bacteroidia bacterium]|nr:biotin--[acetyl-CoA-carboxylase] ligase [Bacteroidia bacterium]MCX7652886.1 biotin--[acetyl-CoA-carboxylase] ligase [Bacteroidia bacterium]MDW8416646.1 biotin--[acetyl-CoA-carboxylase] ligase [Bacteroidia bacterium]
MGWMTRHFFPELDSTQTLLREWAETTPLSHGTLVWTKHQRAGYGRRGHSWFSTSGESLTCSFFLQNGIEPSTLLVRTALALYDTIRPYSSNPLYLKWPNDLWSAPEPMGKLAGILGEIRWESSRPRYAIIGIGVNVYQTAFPPNIPAVSLRQIGTPPPSIEQLLEGFEEAFAQWYLSDSAYVRKAFLKRAWRTGTLHIDSQCLHAQLMDWDEKDMLHFATEKGLYPVPALLATDAWKPRFCA